MINKMETIPYFGENFPFLQRWVNER